MTKRFDFAVKQLKEHPENYHWNYTNNDDPPWSYIAPGVAVDKWVEIGKRVIIHGGVKLGTQGFGFEKYETGEYFHIPHIGKLIIEDDVEVLENSVLCRGTVDNTIIGKGTKIDALCHISHNCKIGKDCFIASYSAFGGSTVLGNGVHTGTGVITRPHIVIADGVYLGTATNVVKNIDRPNSVWAGNPARYFRERTPEDIGG
jgi:UDP-3-O-[3-hydroxymyristoyl] glucosamine N-acyltransferase